MNLSKQYKWLENESSPKLLKEALNLYGTLEIKGDKNNPVILAWAKEIGLDKVYTNDAIAWCGLFIAYVVHKAGYEIVESPLWALSWAKFGTKQTEAELGDILTFVRPGGGHVAIYIGEDSNYYHVLGGNQSDSVSITRIAKGRCKSISRSPFKIGEPNNVRKIILSPTGIVSTNES